MQPPYTVAQMADRAGTGQQRPIPQDVPCCVSCGCVVPTGRIYCNDRACRRRRNTIGTTVAQRVVPLPTIGTYNA